MTTLVSVASQSFGPQTRNLNFSVAANATRIQLTLTHPDWPQVPLLIHANLTWAGVDGGLFSCGGDLIRNKAGVPIGGTDVLTWSASKPPGLTSGTCNVQVLETLTTAILVESF